jgi:outer membrane autotransporter protein
MKSLNFNRGFKFSFFFLSLTFSFGIQAGSNDLLILNGSGLSSNQVSAGNAINILCPKGLAGFELQTRCDRLILGRQQTDTISDGELGAVLGQTTSEQTAAQGTNAIEMSNTQQNNIGGRFATIRQGRQGGLHLSGLSMRDHQGSLLSRNELDKLSKSLNPLAAGDGSSVFDRLGIFINGSIDIGDRETTVNEVGFGSDTYGTTLGVDYRFTDNVVLGVAFGYGHTDTEFAHSSGSMDNDSFSGSIYGTFYTENGFYVDGIFSGSSLHYETRRNIKYSVNAGTAIADNVNTSTRGENEGQEYNAALSGGYNFNIGGLTLTPQVRLEYINKQIDSLDERGGQGWAMHIDEQNIDSLTTAVGGQVSYPFSFFWGVLMPTVRAEWVHEFYNDDRVVTAHYIQDPTRTKVNILTDSPDRDFMYLGTGLSAQFTHGFSAFVNYETLLAHKYASSHAFTGGLRYELAF